MQRDLALAHHDCLRADARQQYRHAYASQKLTVRLMHGEERRRGVWLLPILNGIAKATQCMVRVTVDVVLFNVMRPCDGPSPLPLVAPRRLLEYDADRRQPGTGTVLGRDARDSRRIEPAGQVRPHRACAPHPTLDSIEERFPELFDIVRFVSDRHVVSNPPIPKAFAPDPSVLSNQTMAGLQSRHSEIRRTVGIRAVDTVGESVCDEFLVETRSLTVSGEDLSQLRGKTDETLSSTKVQRSHAERISNAQQPTAGTVPKPECVVANQLGRAIVAPGFVRRQDQLRIVALLIRIPPAQVGDQRPPIVKASVKRQHASRTIPKRIRIHDAVVECW